MYLLDQKVIWKMLDKYTCTININLKYQIMHGTLNNLSLLA